MNAPALSPQEVAGAASRAGRPLEDARLGEVTATAAHILGVIAVLRDLDLEGVAPAATYDPTAADGSADAAADADADADAVRIAPAAPTSPSVPAAATTDPREEPADADA